MAKIMVESLRRLYLDGKIPKKKIDALYDRRVITAEEHSYILAESVSEEN